jgi:hypothetical protein
VEMWGAVVVDDDSIWFCGATWGTNNTGEIIGRMCRAGADVAAERRRGDRHPRDHDVRQLLRVNMVTGRWQPNTNVALVE